MPGMLQRIGAWARGHPKIATVVAVVVLLKITGPFTGEDDAKPAADKPAASASPSPSAEPAVVESPSETPSASSSPATKPEPKSDLEKLQDAAKDADGVKGEKVAKTGVGTYEVKFNVPDNLTKSFIRTGIARNVFKLAEEFDKTGVKIREIAFRGPFPLSDKYGNTKPGTVFFTTLTGSTISKVNYDNIVTTQFDTIENLAVDGIVVLHPDLR